ncbi:LemA family protein [Candidatus Magnetaquicoccus inordinatus]|uniref:LemA family protein n=1 Tax=Candidatus Magnetaquicoccus inordinatus TaxID=2496818 RepID=UPI00102CFF16|nr:LemA family protein [Candidatus Magnetaquicoccus inordinatus]
MTDKSDPLEEIDGSGLEMTSSERMQRMRKLMRQLYQEEQASRTMPLPVTRTRNLVLAASVGAALILLGTTFYNFNRFIAAEEMVLSARGHIHDALQRRSNLFGNLVNLTLNHAMLEQEVFRYVSDGRIDMAGRSASKQASMTPVAPVGGELPSSALARLFALVEQYPDIKTSTTYQQLMDKLMDIENMISKRRDEYNEQVRIYNTTVTSFPWSIMAKVLGFKRHAYFTAEPGPENANMDLNGNKFIRLIPEMEFDTSNHQSGKPHQGNNARREQTTSGGEASGASAPQDGKGEVSRSPMTFVPAPVSGNAQADKRVESKSAVPDAVVGPVTPAKEAKPAVVAVPESVAPAPILQPKVPEALLPVAAPAVEVVKPVVVPLPEVAAPEASPAKVDAAAPPEPLKRDEVLPGPMETTVGSSLPAQPAGEVPPSVEVNRP